MLLTVNSSEGFSYQSGFLTHAFIFKINQQLKYHQIYENEFHIDILTYNSS